TRTNVYNKIEFSNYVKLISAQQKELIETDFKSGDIYEILASDLPKVKAYNQAGQKEIPNTINVNFDPTDFDPNRAFLWLLSQRIKNGDILIEEEWSKFCGLSLYSEPGSEKFALIKEKGFDENGDKKPLVRYYELEAKLY